MKMEDLLSTKLSHIKHTCLFVHEVTKLLLYTLNKQATVFLQIPSLVLLFLVLSAYEYVNPLCPNPGQREKINLNFSFCTSLWCLKRFYKGLKGLYKTFWGTTKK